MKKMIKAGTILIDIKNKSIAIIYREKQKDYFFPKGRIEGSETIMECAIRETEEETKRKCIILEDKPIFIEKYIPPSNEDVSLYYYLARDGGKSNNTSEDTHDTFWIPFDEVSNKLTYDSLKKVWSGVKDKVYYLNK